MTLRGGGAISTSMSQSPLRAAIVPVTPIEQNCTLIWCTETMKAAVIDPGGDLPRIKAAIAQAGVTVEKILLTHGHIDHAGEAKPLADGLGVPIEGPHEADRFWLARLARRRHGRNYGIRGVVFEPDRWLVDGDTVTDRRPDARRLSRRRGTRRGSCDLPPRALRNSRRSATCCSRDRSGERTFRAAAIRR